MMEDTITRKQVNWNYLIKPVCEINMFRLAVLLQETDLITEVPIWVFGVYPIWLLMLLLPLCRDLHGACWRPLSGERRSNSSTGWACRSCALSVQSQCAEVGHSGLLEWPLTADPRSVHVWGVCILQPHPPTPARWHRGLGAHCREAGDLWIQRDPLHFQRHFPLLASSQEITPSLRGVLMWLLTQV